MSSYPQPNLKTYKMESAILIGEFVKFGTADDAMTKCGDGEACVGISQSDAASGEFAAIALPGNGALVKLATTLARGVFAASDASGHAVAPALNDRIGALLLESGVDNDLVACMVMAHDNEV